MTPDQLRAWRHRAGWMQQRLAARLGLAVSRCQGHKRSATIVSWENGHTPIPPWVPLALFAIEHGHTLADVPTAEGMRKPRSNWRKPLRKFTPEDFAKITELTTANPMITNREIAAVLGRNAVSVASVTAKLRREGKIPMITRKRDWTTAEKIIVKNMEGSTLKAIAERLPGRTPKTVAALCFRMKIKYGHTRRKKVTKPTVPSLMSDATIVRPTGTTEWRSAVAGPQRN